MSIFIVLARKKKKLYAEILFLDLSSSTFVVDEEAK